MREDYLYVVRSIELFLVFGMNYFDSATSRLIGLLVRQLIKS